MRTTVTLDQDVYEAASHLARASGRRPGRVLSDLARRGLQPAPALPHRRGKEAFAFPRVAVPAGTPIISASRVDEYLDQEGYI